MKNRELGWHHVKLYPFYIFVTVSFNPKAACSSIKNLDANLNFPRCLFSGAAGSLRPSARLSRSGFLVVRRMMEEDMLALKPLAWKELWPMLIPRKATAMLME